MFMKMKKEFETPVVRVICLDVKDIIATSGEGGANGPGNGEIDEED